MPFGWGEPSTPTISPDDLPTPAGSAAAAPAIPPAVYLSQQEQAAIIAAMPRYAGWVVTGGAAVPETKLGTGLGGRSTNVPTGAYNISISDPSGKSAAQTVTIYPGNAQPDGTKTWIPVPPTEAPKASTVTPPTAASQGTQVTGQGVWGPDPSNPNGPWIQQVKPTDAEQQQAAANVTKTLTDIGYTDVQAKALADKTPSEIAQAMAAAGASQASVLKTQQDVDQAQKLFPGVLAKQQADLAQTNAGTANTQATTGQTQANTQQILSATQIAANKAGPEIGQINAATGASNAAAGASNATTARTNQTIAQGNAPTVADAGSGPVIMQRDPNTGALTPTINPGYMPKTQAEVAGRVGQLQAAAQAQRDQLLQKQQAGQITGDQANQQFNAWWAQNVEPQKAMLAQAQQTAADADQRLQQEQQRNNLSTAQTGAGAILTATENNRPNSPAYAAALGSVLANTRGAPKGVDFSAALSAPGLNAQDIYEQATAKMLAHISPTAAQIATGQPVPTALGAAQNMDVGQALNQTQYSLGGAPPPMSAAPPPAAPAPVAPPPPPPPTQPMAPTDYAALQQRILQDQQDQLRQAQFNYTPPNYVPAIA